MPRETDAQIEERAERAREQADHERWQARGYTCACDGPFHRRYCPLTNPKEEQ